MIVALVAATFAVSQTCQKDQVRLTKDQAIAKAEAQVDFTSQRTQIKLLRQGVPSKPFWVVSLSRPGKQPGSFSELAVVRINANTGKVETVDQQR